MVFLITVCFVVVLLTVSILAAEVSVATLPVSIFIVVSVLVLMEVDESTLAESAEPAFLLPLQAASDKERASAKKGSLSEFFMRMLFKVLIFNKFDRNLFCEFYSNNHRIGYLKQHTLGGSEFLFIPLPDTNGLT